LNPAPWTTRPRYLRMCFFMGPFLPSSPPPKTERTAATGLFRKARRVQEPSEKPALAALGFKPMPPKRLEP
ncbi:hypothetical protein M9458_025347, partial [Cirrhinus mrigala]